MPELGLGLSLQQTRFSVSRFDPNASAFFVVAGITDPTQKVAINQYILDLKRFSVWSLMRALYPFVGSSAGQHSYNLVNPATFQITWNGTVTQDANGVTGDGSTGYGNCGIASDDIGANGGASFYARNTDLGGNRSAFGADDNVNLFRFTMDATQKYGIWGQSFGSITLQAGAPTAGMWAINRTSSTDLELYKNGVSLATSIVPTTYVSVPELFYVCALNNTNLPQNFTSLNLALQAFHAGMTPTQAANFYTATQTYQTALGRQV